MNHLLFDNNKTLVGDSAYDSKKLEDKLIKLIKPKNIRNSKNKNIKTLRNKIILK
jgi:hypothetical protein